MDFTAKAQKIKDGVFTVKRLAADLRAIHRAGQRRMRKRASDECSAREARMEAVADKRLAEGKPATVAASKADAMRMCAEVVKSIPIE